MKKKLQKHYACPAELAMDFIGGKWKAIILANLRNGPLRYNELRSRLPDISNKVLTERLRELETLGLVQKAKTVGIASSYQLTDIGCELKPALEMICQWGKSLAPRLGISIGQNDIDDVYVSPGSEASKRQGRI